MGLSDQVVEDFKTLCYELNQLPKDWTFNVIDDDEKRVSFVKISTRETTYNHPTLGGLPPPWILKLVRNTDGKLHPMYYNRNTKEKTKENPRYMDSTLALHSGHVPKSLRIAATTTRNSSKIQYSNLKRTPIDYHRNSRHQYTKIHTIDPGDGTIGGMNGGVFVVSIKGLANRIFIEKRFRSDDVSFAKKEIEMMHRVRHPSLANFVAGFILEHSKPPEASLYIEFCDRGSLGGLIDAFASRRNAGDKYAKVPEGFVWHAFTGLADGLAYLQYGVPMLKDKNAKPDPNWIPILHRDIKPDNVLLRSRSTLGSKKYFYCVLSDFGLACEDRDDRDPNADLHQVKRIKLGTKLFWAPELCYDPFPRSYPSSHPQSDLEWMVFPNGQRHSQYSDVWALGASIFNLCSPSRSSGCMSHISWDHMPGTRDMTKDKCLEGTICRRFRLVIPPSYSRQLSKAIMIATAWDMKERPDPVMLVQILDPLVTSSGFSEQGPKHEPLPEWATKVHEYLSKAEKINKSNKG